MMRSTHLLQVLMLCTVLMTVYVTRGEDAKDMCNFSTYQSSEASKAGRAKIAPLIGHVFQSSTSQGAEKYKFRVGICTNPDPSDNDAAVIQQKYKDGKTEEGPGNIGSLKDTHIMSGTDWVVLEYKGGDKYHQHCAKEEKRTVIVITCDPDIDSDKAEMVFMEEQRDKTEFCYYLFEMKHQAVCPKEAYSSGLSVGSILVIVFFVVAGMYLLVGFVYSRFVLGSKGIEQIPNYEFWKDFGNLQADGCNFVCRTSGRSRPGGFRGVGDDQLDAGEEHSIRDENLLPM